MKTSNTALETLATQKYLCYIKHSSGNSGRSVWNFQELQNLPLWRWKEKQGYNYINDYGGNSCSL